ncbi:MAG: 30S ribosomal protein S20 [Ignavibacteriaceae bacterium]|nr:30S ribosomal protein S20 [Ignavibacteriaceae bacterium]
MANHKSAKKRIRQSLKRKDQNKMALSKMKTLIKKALASTTKEEAAENYKSAVSCIDRTSSQGRLHKNNAARKKSQLTKFLNSLEKNS